MRVAAMLAFCTGCSFTVGAMTADDTSPTGDAGGSGDDAQGGGPAGPRPLHLGDPDGEPGPNDWAVSGTVTIDTSGTPSITGASLPSGDTFDVRPQLGGGPDLAVLHVGAVTIASGARVTIRGSRPLVIIAGGAVEIAGELDAGGHGTTAGAGGGVPGVDARAGAGIGGGHGTNASDSGGGGAGYGAVGASGGAISGTCTVAGGVPGTAFGDPTLTKLDGGAAGGASSGLSCTPDKGGAGGGALQVTSPTSITIQSSGRVHAGGGGGRGGTDCSAADGDVNSGAGGGSGGAIVLQAPIVRNAGIVAANGGGGGGSSSTGNGSANPGNDGQPSAAPATGGTGPRAMGGSGGAGATVPTAGGGSSCGTNGAGGGGSVGRIATSSGYQDTGTTSPAPNLTLPP